MKSKSKTLKTDAVFLSVFVKANSVAAFCLTPFSSWYLSVFVFIHLQQVFKPKHKRVSLSIPIQKILETGE